MARETLHIVQSFNPGARGSLRADPPVQLPSADRARRMAEKLSASKLGVVAFSATGDADAGDFDDRPAIHFKAGRLPIEFDD